MTCNKIPSREEFRRALVQKQGEDIVQKLEQSLQFSSLLAHLATSFGVSILFIILFNLLNIS